MNIVPGPTNKLSGLCLACVIDMTYQAQADLGTHDEVRRRCAGSKR
jgi:hypothetical protein